MTTQIPPSNADAEETVLGACLISPVAIEACQEELAPTDFYRETHGLIYAAILRLHTAGEPVDAITVADHLDKRLVRGGSELAAAGGKARVFELAAIVPATGNARHHARIVHEYAVARSLIRFGTEAAQLGFDHPLDAAGMIDWVQERAFSLTGSARSQDDMVPVSDALADTFRRIEAAQAAGKDVTGVPSGYIDLDALTLGFQPGNLVIIAARPSQGKSSLSLGIAMHVAVHLGLPVAFFTLEMSLAEVSQRLLSMEALVDSQRIRTGKLDATEWSRLLAGGGRVEKAPLWIEDNAALTIGEVRSKARRLKLRHPTLALVIVDYLQLIGAEAENRTQEVSKVSRALKVLAGELEVPVIALSQLSRALESRHDKRPILSDLRESGGLEADADTVMFIYRDEYYNPESAAEDGTEGIAEINVAKQRNGPTGMRKLAFVKRFARFSNLASQLPGTGAGE